MKTWSGFLSQFYNTSQSLETFESCPLAFYKKYYEGLRWDKPFKPEERAAIDRGNDFHLLARRYFLGVDPGLKEGAKDYEQLAIWLENLKEWFAPVQDARFLPEYRLRSEAGGMRLEANFDLVAVRDDRLEIWDWKTGFGDRGTVLPSQERALRQENRPPVSAKRLRNSLQTAVYLYVLKERSAAVFGKEYDFEDISMHYWQPEPARVITEIRYSGLLHEGYGGRLRELVKSMEAFDVRAFDKNLYSKHCKYCEFNWFCSRAENRVERIENESTC